jgi:addiction module RelB/DinJ family antitoxin
MAAIAKTELFRARIDRGRKARTEKILKRYGLTPGEAVNVFFAKVEEVGGIPFDLRPDDETRELLANPEFMEVLNSYRAGKLRFTAVDALAD